MLYKLLVGGQIQREGTSAGASLGGHTIGVERAAPGTIPLDGVSRPSLEWAIDNCGMGGSVASPLFFFLLSYVGKEQSAETCE